MGFPSVLFPFPPVPIPIHAAVQLYITILLFITVRVLHHHRYSTEILIIYYHCITLISVVGKLGTQDIDIWRVATASDNTNNLIS